MNCTKRKTHEMYKDDEYICEIWTIDDVLVNAKENHDYMRHHDLFLELKCFNSHEILERLIEHFEENLECIKKNEPVKNNLQWYWDIESYRR